jgi:hypothetical protein
MEDHIQIRIEKCNSFQEISELLLKRKEIFIQESEQIKLYLQVQKLEVENINEITISSYTFEKRINYLKELDNLLLNLNRISKIILIYLKQT